MHAPENMNISSSLVSSAEVAEVVFICLNDLNRSNPDESERPLFGSLA